jgi:hypothetical protein
LHEKPSKKGFKRRIS